MIPKEFVFVTHKTPSSLQSPLRKKLYDLYREALLKQSYSNWKALIIGEEEFEDEHFKIVKLDISPGLSIKEQLTKLYDRADVSEYLKNSDFLVKIDDDDIISPSIIQKMSTEDFDICFDRYHTVYDVTSGAQTQEQFVHIASTCIHRTSHALAPFDPERSGNYYSNSVLYTDHSLVWHIYYADKKKVITPKEHPVYLRVLSPTSITAGGKKKIMNKVEDIDFVNYYKYLKTFGYWKHNCTKDFDAYKPALKSVWNSFSEAGQKNIEGIGKIDLIVDKIIHYGRRIRKLF